MAEKIGQILIRKGKINPTQLREALRTQQFFGGYLGSHLINLGFIDEATLGEILSEVYRVPFAPFDSIRLSRPEVLAKVPGTLAQRFRVVPIQIEGNRLHLVMLNPRDAVAINEISAATGLNVSPWVAPEFRIVQALEKHYQLRKPGRVPIRITETADTFPSLHTPEAGRPEAAAVRSDDRPVEVGVICLDGHPIEATVMPTVGNSRPAASHAGPFPRSLEEWREVEEGFPPDTVERRGSGARGGAPAPSSAGRGAAEPSLRKAPSGESGPPGSERLHSPQPEIRPAVEGRTPAGLEALSEAMAVAASRDDLAREVVLFMARKFRRAAAFSIRQDCANGWVGAGEGLSPEHLREVSVPMGSPSIFSAVSASQSLYIGPAPDSDESRKFYSLLGGVRPPAVLMIGVALRDRLISILYADNLSEPLGPLDLALWKRLGRMMEVSLEIIILRNKMKHL